MNLILPLHSSAPLSRVVSTTAGLVEKNTPFHIAKTLLLRLLGIDKCRNLHEREQLLLSHVTMDEQLDLLPLLNDLLVLKVCTYVRMHSCTVEPWWGRVVDGLTYVLHAFCSNWSIILHCPFVCSPPLPLCLPRPAVPPDPHYLPVDTRREGVTPAQPTPEHHPPDSS